MAHPLSMASLPAIIVPPVAILNGRSRRFCTIEFGRMATGGTSTTMATLVLDCVWGVRGWYVWGVEVKNNRHQLNNADNASIIMSPPKKD